MPPNNCQIVSISYLQLAVAMMIKAELTVSHWFLVILKHMHNFNSVTISILASDVIAIMLHVPSPMVDPGFWRRHKWECDCTSGRGSPFQPS